jgi:hypothetical protein
LFLVSDPHAEFYRDGLVECLEMVAVLVMLELESAELLSFCGILFFAALQLCVVVVCLRIASEHGRVGISGGVMTMI